MTSIGFVWGSFLTGWVLRCPLLNQHQAQELLLWPCLLISPDCLFISEPGSLCRCACGLSLAALLAIKRHFWCWVSRWIICRGLSLLRSVRLEKRSTMMMLLESKHECFVNAKGSHQKKQNSVQPCACFRRGQNTSYFFLLLFSNGVQTTDTLSLLQLIFWKLFQSIYNRQFQQPNVTPGTERNPERTANEIHAICHTPQNYSQSLAADTV